MYGMIGCAGIVALVFLPFGLLMALLTPHGTFLERVVMAFMPSGMAFIAATLLAMRDQWLSTTRMRMIRRNFLNRDDISLPEYLSHFSDIDPTLISQIRQAVSEFFDVPAEKIHPADSLTEDLMLEAFEPGFHSFVLYRVMGLRQLEPVPSQIISFHTDGLFNLGDLAIEVQRVINSLKYA